MENSFAKPMGYDKPWTVTYPVPTPKDLNATFPNGQGVNKSPWPTNNKLASQSVGTKAVITGKPAESHPTFGGFDEKLIIHSKVASNSVKESAKSMIF